MGNTLISFNTFRLYLKFGNIIQPKLTRKRETTVRQTTTTLNQYLMHYTAPNKQTRLGNNRAFH